MRTTIRRATATTLMAVAGITTAAVLANGGAGAVAAENIGTHNDVAIQAPKDASASAQAAAPDTRKETGVVLEGSGDGVLVFLYENSQFGSSLQVVLGDPDEDRIGFIEQAEPFIVDGRLDVTVDVQGKPVRLSGTVTAAGEAAPTSEQVQDAGEMRIVKGTHTQLATDVTAQVGRAAVAVEFAPAFAFDLDVRVVDLYGPHA